jgi:hypothetical protein
MATTILSHKRYEATSEQQRILQNQISDYAGHTIADELERDLKQRRNPPRKLDPLTRLDSIIERYIALVNDVMCPALPEDVGLWDTPDEGAPLFRLLAPFPSIHNN